MNTFQKKKKKFTDEYVSSGIDKYIYLTLLTVG